MTMTCAIVGDSIALGTAEAEGLAARYRPPCSVNAKIGIPSGQIIGRVSDADLLVVSAGSNDPDNPELEKNLEAIRAKATGKVLWILPAVSLRAALIVDKVAGKHGDKVVAFTPGRDHTHPLSYVPSIAEIQRELKP